MKPIDWLYRLLSSIFRHPNRDRVFHAAGGGEPMAYPAKVIADYFIRKARSDKKEFTQIHLQKILYLAYGWYLAAFRPKQRLINEEPEAWPLGPVFPSIYHALKKFGSGNIDSTAIGKDPQIIDSDDIKIFLDLIWDLYGSYSGPQLVSLTHEKGSPWHTTWVVHSGESGHQIPDDIISEYFEEQLK